MNPAALHPMERGKEAACSSLPLCFEDSKWAVAQGLWKGMKSQEIPQRAVVPHVATEQKTISAHRLSYTELYEQKGNHARSATDMSPTETPSVIQIFMLRYSFIQQEALFSQGH